MNILFLELALALTGLQTTLAHAQIQIAPPAHEVLSIQSEVKSDKTPTLTQGEIRTFIVEESRRQGVWEVLALSIAEWESNFNPKAINPKSNASGLYQFLPNMTWKRLCTGDIFNPKDNATCAIRLLSEGKINHWRADPAMRAKIDKLLGNMSLVRK